MKQPASLKNRLIAAGTAWIVFGMVAAWLISGGSGVGVFRMCTQLYLSQLFV